MDMVQTRIGCWTLVCHHQFRLLLFVLTMTLDGMMQVRNVNGNAAGDKSRGPLGHPRQHGGGIPNWNQSKRPCGMSNDNSPAFVQRTHKRGLDVHQNKIGEPSKAPSSTPPELRDGPNEMPSRYPQPQPSSLERRDNTSDYSPEGYRFQSPATEEGWLCSYVFFLS
jgi:hypothetical protein